MKQNSKTIKVSLILLFLGMILFNRQLLANSGLKIKADEIVALSNHREISNEVKIVAWTYDGVLYFLGKDLSLKRKIKIPKVSISDIVQVSKSLYILSSMVMKTGETMSVLIQYNIEEGREKKRWSNSKYYIWSISVKNNMVLVISSEGELLKLGSNDFEETAQYPQSSHYIPVDEADPIICTDPDLTKLNWTPALCYREGRFTWKRDGEWQNLTPPFLCDNYLIEKNVQLKKNVARISISDISSGRQISEFMDRDIKVLKCIENKIIYSSKSNIIIRSLPNLKKICVLNTNSNEINSIAKIENAIFYVDDKRKIYKQTY